MDAPSTPVLAEGQPQKLHPAIRKVWQISALLSGLIIAVGLGFPEYMIIRNLDSWPIRFPIVGPLLGLINIGIAWAVAGRQYDQWTYTLREHDLVISYGLVWRKRRSVARDRVQHLDVNSGPLDRRFGLVQVSIYAAGALGGIGSIPGMTPEAAEALRAALLDRKAADA